MSLHALIGCQRAYSETDVRAALARVTVPALVVHGAADISMPLDRPVRRAARLLPDARLQLYEVAPHGLMFTHTARLNDDLHAFIARPPSLRPCSRET